VHFWTFIEDKQNFGQRYAFRPKIDCFFILIGRVFTDFWPVLDFLAQDFLDWTLLDEEIFCQHLGFLGKVLGFFFRLVI
jgi:hypothetical protein